MGMEKRSDKDTKKKGVMEMVKTGNFFYDHCRPEAPAYAGLNAFGEGGWVCDHRRIDD